MQNGGVADATDWNLRATAGRPRNGTQAVPYHWIRGAGEEKMRFSEKQLRVMTWWKAPYDGIICDGAIRAGKTYAMSCGFFLWSMARFDGGVFALCGKTVGSLRRNVILQLPEWLGREFHITEHRSENKIVVRLGRRENTYYLFGGQDEGSYMLIQGITLAGVFLDEVALMPRSFVEQACARCSVVGSKLWFNCNPASPEHWFFTQWVKKAEEKNVLHLHFTMEDNPGLSQEVKDRYEALYTGVFYRRYVLGQWCQAEGLVYDFQKEKHLAEFSGSGRYYISVDYGTQNPFSAGLWCVSGGKAYRLGEFYHNGREKGCLTDEEYYGALEALAGNLPVEAVVIDPSAASFITLLRRRGRFRVKKAKNAVLSGIRLVSSLLHQGKLLISPRCTDAIREFSLYCWEENADAPVKENDHAMDDIRYFCATVMGRQL